MRYNFFKNFLLLIIFICFFSDLFAKKDSLKLYENVITASALSLRLTKSSNMSIEKPNLNSIQVFGFSYTRDLGSRFNLGIGYYKWYEFSPNGQDVQLFTGPTMINPNQEKGLVDMISNYKMVDLCGIYSYALKKNIFKGAIGLSYTWGINNVIDTIYVMPFDDIVVSHNENGQYLGFLTYFEYSYLLFNNHLSIGYKICWRRYFNMYSPQLQNGITLSFLF